MVLSVDWGTKVISVPQSDLVFVSGVTFELDSDAFRLELKDLEDDEGMPFLDTHRHNTEVTVGTLVLARTVEIINGYTVSFEDTGTPYIVSLVGSNNNIQDVTNLVDNVSVRSNNSAGLIGSLSGQVWDADAASHNTAGTMGAFLNSVRRWVSWLRSLL